MNTIKPSSPKNTFQNPKKAYLRWRIQITYLYLLRDNSVTVILIVGIHTQNMRSRLRQLLTLGMLTFILSGCSISGTYYLRNFTSEPVKIILTLTNIGIGILEEPTFSYSSEILKIQRNLYKKLKNSVRGTFIDKGTLEFEVPAESTMLLTFGLNMKMHFIETIEIQSIKGTELINSENSELMNLKMRGIGKYTGHYDIK